MTVTVLSGPERRRRWTRAEKLRLVEETLAPEASIAEVGRRHDIHPNLLHAWRRQMRMGVLTNTVDGKPARDAQVRFVPVAIAPEAPALPAAIAVAAAGVIEVEFAAGDRMRITGGVEPSLVSALIERLAKSRGQR
jgi:transposase